MRNITTKLLIPIGIATIFFLFFLFYQDYIFTNKRVRKEVEQQVSMALKFNLAIREYIAKNVRSVMYKLLGPDEFMPETMSTSYVARSIFEDVRNEFPGYIIKFASDNPRNPINQAGPEELKIIEYLNNNPQLQRWEGAISIAGKPYFAKFSAMRVEERCLRCHGNPDDAPESLLKRYGSTAGFHRPLGQVIGLDTVAIPIAKISEKLWPELLKTFPVIALGLLIFFIAIVSVTKFVITNRLTMISMHFKNAAQQEDYSNINPIEIKGKDEIFDLAFSFNTLSDKLKSFYSSLEMQVKERTRELEDTNVRLKQEIGERKQAEEKLTESEGKLKTILETIPDPIVMYDTQGHPKYINPAFIQIFGWSVDELRGKRIPFVPEDQKDITSAKLKELFDFGKPVRIESKRLTKEGLLFDVHISAALIKDSDGKSTGIVVNLTNITERKKLEEEREKLIHELQNALAQVKILSGLLPICAHCKNIRDDKGYWNKIESYIHQHSEAEFSHGICPECAKKFYPDFDLYDDTE